MKKMILRGNMNCNYAATRIGYSTGWKFEGGTFLINGWTKQDPATLLKPI